MFERAIPAAARKCPAMNVIVFDDAGDEREDAGYQKQRPMTQPASPLDEKQNTQQHQKKHRTPVCRMTQRRNCEEKILCTRESPASPLALSEWNLRLHCGNNRTAKEIKQWQSSSASIENFATPSKLSIRLDRHSA
jgi:hypothetical protein